MARVTILEKESVSEDLRELFQKMEDNGQTVLNLFKVMANSPEVGRAFLRLGNRILLKNSIDPRLRELAILRVGDLAKANYEFTQHVPIARRVGVTDEQIEALPSWSTADCFNDHERSVLQYTDEVAEKIRATDETFEKIKTFLSDQQIVDLTTTIGYYGMVSRILESLQIELES